MQELWLGQFMIIVKFLLLGLVCVRPGSGLSPWLFAVVMEAICREFPVVLSCELR